MVGRKNGIQMVIKKRQNPEYRGSQIRDSTAVCSCGMDICASGKSPVNYETNLWTL